MDEGTEHRVDITPVTERSSSSGVNTHENRITRMICQAVLEGSWEDVKTIYTWYRPEVSYNSIVTRRNETVLHIAVTAATYNLKFVEKVVEEMSDEALETRDSAGNTAFFVATSVGKIEFAKVMKKRKPDLAMISGGKGELPLYMAASRGYTKMARWLYEETKSELKHEDKIKIFVALISSNIYDVALHMAAGDDGALATARGPSGESALFALAQKTSLTWDLSNLQDFAAFEERFSGIITWKNFIYKDPLRLRIMKHVWKNFFPFRHVPLWLVTFILETLKSDESKISDVIDWKTISTAVQNGNADLLRKLIVFYPDLLYLQSDDGNGYTIVHLAVLHRQEDIFRLIHQFYSITERITSHTDNKGNNILHLAAKLPITSKRLQAVSEPVLKMHIELLWYKEVEKVVPVVLSSEMNKRRNTPEDEFRECHKNLLIEAERWIRGTADKCMLVAALVATVVFSAAFQLPGAVSQNGTPNFLHKTAFKFFFMADAVSLVSSVASVMIFLGLMTSKYQIHDFHASLPRKLIIGLGLLLISLGSMLMAFVATTFLVFNHGNKDKKDQHHAIGLIEFAIPIAVIGSWPIILFIWMLWGLFMDAWIQLVNPKSISLQKKWVSSSKAFREINFDENLCENWKKIVQQIIAT